MRCRQRAREGESEPPGDLIRWIATIVSNVEMCLHASYRRVSLQGAELRSMPARLYRLAGVCGTAWRVWAGAAGRCMGTRRDAEAIKKNLNFS